MAKDVTSVKDLIDEVQGLRVSHDTTTLAGVRALDDPIGILPYKIREVVSIHDDPGVNIKKLLQLLREGKINIFEYLYSIFSLSTDFRQDPNLFLAGAKISSEGHLEVIIKNDTPTLPQKNLRRFIDYTNATISTGLYKRLNTSYYEGVLQDVIDHILEYCGPVDVSEVADLLSSQMFIMKGEGGSFEGMAKLMCSLRKADADPGCRDHFLVLPTRIFRFKCKELRFSRSVLASTVLAKTLNYIVEPGDIIIFKHEKADFSRALLFTKDESDDAPLGDIIFDCDDEIVKDDLINDIYSIIIRIKPKIFYNEDGFHFIFPEEEDGLHVIKTRVCPVCGTMTFLSRCPRCGSVTKPTRYCPNCGAATSSLMCERCGTPTVDEKPFRVEFTKNINRSTRLLGLSRRNVIVKGFRHFRGAYVEDPIKGLLRQTFGVFTRCDGTSSVLFTVVHDRDLPRCGLLVPKTVAKLLYKTAMFIDELYSKFFSSTRLYSLGSPGDLTDKEVVVTPAGGTIGFVTRVAGVVEDPVGFVGSSLSSNMISVTMFWDYLLNFSLDLARELSSRCSWGFPAAVIPCDDSDDGPVPVSEELAFPKSTLSFDGSSDLADAARVGRLMMNVIASNTDRGINPGFCRMLNRVITRIVHCYFHHGLVCRECGARIRRPTIDNRCPYCGGQLLRVPTSEDLNDVYSLVEMAVNVCGQHHFDIVYDDLERLMKTKKQTRLTEFL